MLVPVHKSDFKGDDDGCEDEANHVRHGCSLPLAHFSPYAHFGVGIEIFKGNAVFDGGEFLFSIKAKAFKSHAWAQSMLMPISGWTDLS